MPTLNYQIIAYLTVNNIAYTSGDYMTGQPEGQPDQIIYWNTEAIGSEPTQAQLDEAWPIYEGQQIAAQNKQQAESLLQSTDWTENASVRNTAKTPHLVNGDEFDDYRVALRVIAVNPPVTVAEWPVKPDEQWSTQ